MAERHNRQPHNFHCGYHNQVEFLNFKFYYAFQFNFILLIFIQL